MRMFLLSPAYHCFDKASTLQPHLLEISVDVEDPVLLRQLDVGIDRQVNAGSTGAVAKKTINYFIIKTIVLSYKYFVND